MDIPIQTIAMVMAIVFWLVVLALFFSWLNEKVKAHYSYRPKQNSYKKCPSRPALMEDDIALFANNSIFPNNIERGINPATGYVMMGGRVDIGGNMYGSSSNL
ncbi:MAG TPA: hypothetical protein PLE99_05745 [Candidatus Thiothrix moscowensis]|uniref:hypothetical protein n=1 Tax=unclassified Thiothrix TaxID=2636184 RepID=UPI0025FD09F2|nr:MULTISPECIES: hypothetical protein [unclassified Thiothrix]HRJ52247.1 hypothetical protein [Candidatus Thiothrix moscowensis]HRJ92562.1 hypothetical protein [Candidatus Thiothrix moscowensis]